MIERFAVGDHVEWNSEAGRVSGRIIRVHTADFDYKGYTHRASPEDPQYEIASDRTDFVNLIWPRGDGLKWPRRGGGSMWVAVCCQAQQEVGSSLRKRFAVRRMPSAMVRYGAQVSASWVTVNPALMA